MDRKVYYFTSESVSCGHPDKICDQISDAILDRFLSKDSESKVAVECFITNNMLVIGGEAHTTATVDIIGTAKRVIEEIGYDGTNGFNPESAVFINTLHEQSSDIRQGVDREKPEEQGAGDQGIMFGYACKETECMLPMEIYIANSIMEVYDTMRKEGSLLGCRPDAKCQVTIERDEKTDEPLFIDTILISMQHDENVNQATLDCYANAIISTVRHSFGNKVFELFAKEESKNFKLLVNPTGRFVIGGPEGDTGLTGRKIIVDTYGGRCPHGGGAFSGKDPSKVDRSAAYAARFIAKNLVAADICEEATVQLSYAIGVAKPISVFLKTKGNKTVYSDSELALAIPHVFPVTPNEIIGELSLKVLPDGISYWETAAYGHFTSPDAPWENTFYCDTYKERLFTWLSNGMPLS